VGVDQDPHLRLARDLASRAGLVPPSSLYHRLMRGLLGEKMSSSRPETAILFRDPPEEMRRKLWNAFTGGRPTEREQRELGGDPSKCVVFELLAYHLVEDDAELARLADACRRGEIICGECKRRTAERLEGFLEQCRRERERRLPNARELAKASF
jgi:tryptophanyl-tRNA synthetase